MINGLLSQPDYNLVVDNSTGNLNVFVEESSMAKKHRRQSPRAVTPAAPDAEMASSGSGSRGIDRNFNPDYSYVIKDLKRIGLLAGFFFGVLIVLSFFL